jgi:hypothetical protein
MPVIVLGDIDIKININAILLSYSKRKITLVRIKTGSHISTMSLRGTSLHARIT